MTLAERLLKGGADYAEAFNFGPSPARDVSVAQVVDRLAALWGSGARWEQDPGHHPHEATALKLNSAKAGAKLGWQPAIDLDKALELTVAWYRAARDGADMRAETIRQIDDVLGPDAVPSALRAQAS